MLTGYSRQTEYRSLLVAPHSHPQRADRAGSSGRSSTSGPAGGGIRLKMNSIVDEEIIDALYRASQAGVPIDLTSAASARCGRRAGL